MDERVRRLERQGRHYEATRERFRTPTYPTIWTNLRGRPQNEEPENRLTTPYKVDERDLAWQAYYLSRFPNSVFPEQENIPGRWDSARAAIVGEKIYTVNSSRGLRRRSTWRATARIGLAGSMMLGPGSSRFMSAEPPTRPGSMRGSTDGIPSKDSRTSAE